MDGNRFDSLARAAAAAPTRRALLGAALGALGSAVFGSRADAARLRNPGEICRKNGDCATDACGPKDRYGRRRCLCNGAADCPQPNAGDPCRTSTCVAGVCGFVINVGTPCDDGNACTTGEACQANGKCGGGAVTVCTASDQCHDAGTCDPKTGACSNPAKPDGTGCSDGNACTDPDTCQSGTCTPGKAKVCQALDQCHTAGTCDPTTGVCSNPVNVGAACIDGNACTTGETCQQDGTCGGGTATICTPLDGCHTAGTCDTTTGTCSNPVANDGTGCTTTGGSAGTCQSGNCVCTPQCSGKACGPDGCNGTCGTCGQGQTCTTNGQCSGSCIPAPSGPASSDTCDPNNDLCCEGLFCGFDGVYHNCQSCVGGGGSCAGYGGRECCSKSCAGVCL